MKIESINIKNFKSIDAFKGDVRGKNIYLIGANGTGKSSFIQAVWCGLTGKDLPPKPVTTGAKKGLIEIDLGDYIARTKFTNGKPAVFEIENKLATTETDKFVKAPRSFMEDKIGILNFNIDEFFSKSNLEQIKYFAKITGSDFSDLDTEILENEDSRKFDKKELKLLEDTLNYYDNADLEKTETNVVDLSKKIALETNRIAIFYKIKEGVSDRELGITILNAEIDKLIAERDLKGKEAQEGLEWLLDKNNIPLTPEDFKTLEDSLNTVELDNKKITSAKISKKQEDDIAILEKNILKNNKNIEDLRTKKAKRISELIKVDGLAYDMEEERFLYNGLPFDKNQINTAAQLIAGMKIGASTLKDLKILKVDASLIDKNNFEEVLTWAEKEQVELFIELVDRDGAQLAIHLDADN